MRLRFKAYYNVETHVNNQHYLSNKHSVRINKEHPSTEMELCDKER